MKRILIVEDNLLLAQMLEDLFVAAGYDVHRACELGSAEAMVASQRFDAAILDVHLNGNVVFPLARTLTDLGTPFLLASAARRIDLPLDLRWQPLIGKPYAVDQVVIALKALCGDVYSPQEPEARSLIRAGGHPSV